MKEGERERVSGIERERERGENERCNNHSNKSHHDYDENYGDINDIDNHTYKLGYDTVIIVMIIVMIVTMIAILIIIKKKKDQYIKR